MGLQKIERARKFLAYEYDFAVDGGTAGAKTMRMLGSDDPLQVGLIILHGFCVVTTAIVGDGTVDIGDGTDVDRWFDTTVIKAASAGAVIDAETSLLNALLASGQTAPILTIGAGGITAGKVVAYFEYIRPL